ncbi:phosphoadenosine phosphosulfate reductase [Candidatus Blochmanniella vafra str. BVAF]|uniref:Phosphoadenosine 5'-phosphosulfate reductase n=1 Tax=Blochmanniella vafra (strain BVAF) TaxID=859654 RepID=E8Q5S1_BLOVB|nr:phosphoadenylyl-sulfate reductase [Candidatus Blochmannia vafer]ADV33568.1 phosphoadenosine phosphosulfate reductase [Candidatus Blochmannia vafer str. BVAF]
MIYRKLAKFDKRFWSIKEFNALSLNEQNTILYELNQYLESLETEDRIKWAIRHLSDKCILSSSFGVYSSVSVHMMTRYFPDIPIILIDTGYLFPETYRFIDHLKEKMRLNLHVFRSNRSAAWQEARYGKLWEQGAQGVQRYNFINKVKPMKYALKTLQVEVWFAGLRRIQSDSRRGLTIINVQNNVFKFLPIIDWNDTQMHRYITQYELEYNPLWKQGYVSIGDVHTTVKKKSGMKDEETRFFGLQRECGLHCFDKN